MEVSKEQELLKGIVFPEDLRKLEVDQLPQVCDELRQDIVQELSVNPGHLASSLGVVELTVALHYVFNTPDDRIVWDVGHQAYGHKILTGRREQFKTNRKLKGIKPVRLVYLRTCLEQHIGSLRHGGGCCLLKEKGGGRHWRWCHERWTGL